MNIIVQSGQLFWKHLRTVRGAIVMAVVAMLVYGLGVLFRDDPVNPLWMILCTIAGGYGAAFGDILYGRWLAMKKEALDLSLLNPTGLDWVVCTIDGARIGEINESDLLKAQFEADTCVITKVLQVFNYLWVAWATLVRTVSLMPPLMIFAALIYHLVGVGGSLADITLGQILESDVLWTSFCVLFAIVLAVLMVSGPSKMPGYKNYYELRLRRLLSRHLPNIANANGFQITGMKIDLDASADHVLSL